MEKLKGNKHNHLFTDLLKVAIFGLMLLLPFLCFMPTGFYYGFNEHATNETTTQINYKYQSNKVNTKDDLIIGNVYHFNFEGGGDEFFYSECVFELLKVYQYNFNNLNPGVDYETWSSILEDSPISIRFESYGSALLGGIFICLNNDENLVYYNLDLDHSLLLNADIRLIYIDKTNVYEEMLPVYFSISDYNVIESVETNVQDTISNKMYLAWEGVWTSPLFNWTNTTPLNTGLNGFIGIFGINQSSYIANCLIYLLSITAIYVVFDIVLGIFKWLTHLIGNK